MKILNIILMFCLVSILSCATVKNSSGYIITNNRYNMYYKQTFCNDQKGVSWYEIDGFEYLGFVFFHIKDKEYVVKIKYTYYKIDINKIIPLEVGQSDALKIAQNAGFHFYEEYQKYFEEQKLLAQKEKERQQEEAKKAELTRLRNEIDKKFGVFAVGSLLNFKNGEVKIGQIIRLGDTFSYNMAIWRRANTGGYIFGDFDEFEIRGLDMKQVNVNVNRPDLSGRFVDGGNMNYGGRRGYIVKYLGTEDVITIGGLRKVRWVCECIGGNIYAE